MITTFVFVHGAFCNSAVWAPTSRELALRGHRTVPVDLPGHGLGATIPTGYLGSQDLNDLAKAPSGMAGISTADDPELIDRLVYISAWCCVDATASEYTAGPENATSLLAAAGGIAVANPEEIGAIRLNWRTANPTHLDALQTALLADGTRDELIAYLHTQDPDEALAVDEQATRADAATWGRIPHTYVRLTEDRAMPLALQDRFIAEADALTPDNPFDVWSVASSHLRFQIHPTEIVEILDGLAVG